MVQSYLYLSGDEGYDFKGHLVRPGNADELIPVPRDNVCNVESGHKCDWNVFAKSGNK